MDDQIQQQIAQYRTIAENAGEKAILAVARGDIGMARTMARRASQYARILVQLETGEKQIEPDA